MRIAGATLNQTPLDWDANFSNIINAIEQAKEAKVELLLLPELAITGYGCEDWFLAKWVQETAINQLVKILPFTKDIIVCVGLPIAFDNQLYNAACMIENEKIIHFYAKQFLANDGVHYEPRWFSAWKASQSGFITIGENQYPINTSCITLKGVKIGIEICEDAWKKDQRPAHRYSKENVQLILNPSASHFSFGKTSLRENEVVLDMVNTYPCTYLYANLLGNEAGRIIYDGEIIIATSQNGIVVKNKRLSFQDVNLAWADVDFEKNSSTTTVTKSDFYDKNSEFVAASALGLFDYMRKSNSKGFVLSLSGGADSSVCAVLVAEMIKRGLKELGLADFVKKSKFTSLDIEVLQKLDFDSLCKELTNSFLITAYQRTVNSTWDTFDSARALAESIGATFYVWDVDKELATYTEKVEMALQRKLSWEKDDITLQNIQARTRAPIIWMFANEKNALLLTTSNRSEGDVGYATMDGDTAGSLAPIAGVDKFFLCNWLVWAESALRYYALAYVNNLSPSAELRPKERSQTDETDLMPYSIMVEIEKLAIQERRLPKDVFEILKKNNLESEDLLKFHIKKFYQMWSRNQWKRERIAPSFMLDTFNVDPRSWCRFPILSGAFLKELGEL